MEINLSSLKNSLVRFFSRYHFILFFLYVAVSIGAGVILIYSTIELSDQSNGYVSQENKVSFDEETIKRLRDLKQPGQATEKLPTAGRVSPF